MLSGSANLNLRKASSESTPILFRKIELEKDAWKIHSNYFAIVWIKEGEGIVETDMMKSKFSGNMIFCFNTYQAFAFHPSQKTVVSFILFHANFFCIETYHHEVGCNGVLFNNVYSTSKITVPKNKIRELTTMMQNIESEINEEELAASELVFSYLKILLIKLTRLKSDTDQTGPLKFIPVPPYLEELKALIDENFRRENQPAFYADKLSMTVKVLSSATKKHYNKTLSALINEKLVLNAKWTLLHTNTPIKQIAGELGFNDEYYFSRFFKKHIGLSPKQFRDEEWAMRRGILSIP